MEVHVVLDSQVPISGEEVKAGIPVVRQKR